MKTELEKEIEGLREDLKKNAVGHERLDKIEETLKGREGDAKTITTLRGDIDKLREAHEVTEKALEEAKRNARVQREAADPISSKREGLRILGMKAREMLGRHERVELPSAFRAEADLLKNYDTARAERATIQVNTGTGGSYTVPTLVEGDVIDTLEEVSMLLSEVDFQTGLPAQVDLPTLTGRGTLKPKRATVDTAMTAGDPTLGQLQFRAEEAYVYFPADNRLLDMEAIALGALLSRLLTDSAVEGMVDWLLNGDGSSTYNGITGILNEATAAYIYDYSTDAFATTVAADIYGQKNKALARGRARGKFLMSEDLLDLLGNITRTGKVPLVTIDANGNYRVAGKQVIIDEGMPTTGADEEIISGFGDPSTYLVGLAGGMQIGVSTEFLFGKNQTAFRNVLNVDIKRKPVATFIAGKTGATA